MSRIKSSDALPRGTADTVIELVDAALSCGWNVTTNRNGIVAISAPPPNSGIRHTFRPGQRISRERIIKSILQHGDPAKVSTITTTVVAEEHGLMPKGSGNAVAEVLKNASINEGNVHLHSQEPEPEPRPKRPVPKHIVSIKPMLARHNKDRAYESKIAEERTWSDGTVDYKCVMCEYHSENRLSVRSHRRRHINEGKADALGRSAGENVVTGVEVPTSTYSPRQARVDALAAVLASLIDDGGTPQEVALRALTWLHQQTRSNSEHAESRATEDLTAEQILDQIRNLLGAVNNPQQQAQIVQLELVNTQMTQRLEVTEEELESVRLEAEEARAERDAANAQLSSLRDDLTSLRELLANLGGE